MSKILVDVDDTIADTQRHMLYQINGMIGSNYRWHQMTREYRERGRDTDPAYERAVRTILDEKPEIMARIIPYPGALEAMAALHDHGFRIHIVSSRQTPLHAVTAQWLKDHEFIDYIEQIHPRPAGVKGKQFKVDVALEQKFIAAFDDTFEVCEALAPHVPLVYLIDKPWNRVSEDELPANVFRVGEEVNDGFCDGAQRLLSWVQR